MRMASIRMRSGVPLHILLLLSTAAFCCFLVSEAGPSSVEASAAASSCAKSCPPTPHWLGFLPGRVYRYRFEHEFELATELPGGRRRGHSSTGIFEVRVLTSCELAVAVRDASAVDGDAATKGARRLEPERTLRALRLPLRVWHSEGSFVQVCPAAEEDDGDGETRESLNLKRALLSQLQVTAVQRGKRQQLEERDIYGDCWTEYTPTEPHKLLKTKDLARCRRLAFEAYPVHGVKGFADERVQASRPVTHGSLACLLELDARRDIPHNVTCQEKRTTSTATAAGETGGDSVRLLTRTRLQFLSEQPLAELPAANSAMRRSFRRSDLRQEHRSSVECQNPTANSPFVAGSECLERAAGVGTSPQQEASELLKELCREAKPELLSRHTPGKFARLIGLLRRIDSPQELIKIYQRLRRGYCAQNPALMSIVRSAVPAAGTQPAVQLMLQQILSERNSWSANVLTQLRHPTTEMLVNILDFVIKRSSRGVWQEEALALGDLVYRICLERPDSASEQPVKRVVEFFSDKLVSTEACRLLEVGSRHVDAAFVALLAVGNMGRVRGGAAALIACAANPRLAPVHRAFALKSLRRFDDWQRQPETIASLVGLLSNSSWDAELRIAAYQSLASGLGHTGPQSVQLRAALQRLLTSPNEDRQVQLFVRFHLAGLASAGSDPLLEKETIETAAKLLRQASAAAPGVWEALDRLSVRQYSSAWRVQHYSPSWAMGGSVEASVVFSAQSAIPRYIGLNVTLIDPSRGRWVNALEVGLRIEGIDDGAHDVYNILDAFFGASKAPGLDIRRRRLRRQTVGVDITSDQEDLKQKALEPRVDIVVRRFGAETSHSTITGMGVSAPLQLLKNLDFSTVSQLMELLPQFKNLFDKSKSSMSAGVLSEEAISLPTISGAPLIVKNDAHYLAELRMDSTFDLSWSGNSTAMLELRPVAALQQSFTVAVDSVFERMGVRINTSWLTNTGVRFSLQRAQLNVAETDEKFSVKLEPLRKRQSLADAKTDAIFFWHEADSQGRATLLEKPLVPNAKMELVEKCSGSFVMKYTGHAICLESEQLADESQSKMKQGLEDLLQSLHRRPSRFQLYLDKDDSFGAFEIYSRLSRSPSADAGSKRLELLIGDRNSSDRMVKLALVSTRSGAHSSWKFELLNPVFPVSFAANVSRTGGGSSMEAEMQIGAVEYKAEGLAQWQSAESPLLLTGTFYRKDKARQRMEISLSHQMNGRAMLLLPRATTKFNLTMQSGNQLRLIYDFQTSVAPDFNWRMSSEYTSPTGVLHSVQYRLQYENRFKGSRRDYGAIMYDLEVHSSEGPRIVHSLHAKLRRSIGVSSQANVSVRHNLRLGPTMRRSPLDFQLVVGLIETINVGTFIAVGSGQLKYFRDREVTAKLEGLRVEMGDAEQIDGDAGRVGRQYLYSIDCGLRYEDFKAEYKGILRFLPRAQWEWLRQAFEAQLGIHIVRQSSEVTHFWHLKNYVNGREPAGRQILKMVHAGETLIHLDHRLQREGGSLGPMKHELFVQSKFNTGMRLQSGVSWLQEGILSVNTSMTIGSTRLFECRQNFAYTGLAEDHQLKHHALLMVQEDVYILETTRQLSRETAASLLRFLQYQNRIMAGRYNLRYSWSLFVRFLASIRFNEKSRLTGSEPDRHTELQNVIDIMQTNGVVWKNQLRVLLNGTEVLNYGLSLLRNSSDGNGESPWLRVVQAEANGFGHSLKTRIEAQMQSDKALTEVKLDLTSSDTWGWHRVAANTSAMLKEKLSCLWTEADMPTDCLLELNAKIDGHVLNRELDSDGMIGIWKDIKAEGKVHRLKSVVGTSKANASFDLQLARSPTAVLLQNSLTNEFSFLPYRQLGSRVEFRRGSVPMSLESEVQVDYMNVVSAKLEHSNTGSRIDLKTKHPQFQEFWLKVGRTLHPELPGAWNVTSIAKFIAFGWNIGLKQSGIVSTNVNPSVIKRLISVKSDIELTGLENYIKYRKFGGEALFRLRHSKEFDLLLLAVTAPERGGKELTLLRLSSILEFSPLLAELKLRTVSSSGQALSYGARLELDPRRSNADFEFGERRAELAFSILQGQVGTATRSVQFRARNSFLVSEQIFIHGTVNSTWPLRAEPLDLLVDLRLSSESFPGVSIQLVNHLERKLALLSIAQANGRVADLIRMSYNQSADHEGIRGLAFAVFDFGTVLDKFEPRSIRADYLFGADKELNFAAMRSSVNTLTGSLFWYATPQPLRPVFSLANHSDFGFVIKSPQSWSIQLLHSPLAGTGISEWRLSIARTNDETAASSPISARIEVTDALEIRTGQVSIFGKEFQLNKFSDAGFELVVKTGTPVVYQVSWSSSSTGAGQRFIVEIQHDNSASLAEIVFKPGQASFKYGSSSAPNVLLVTYIIGQNSSLTVAHSVHQVNSKVKILPGITIRLPTTPFSLTLQNQGGVKGHFIFNFDSPAVGSLTYRHNLSRFPQLLSASGNLTRSTGGSLWQLSANMDRIDKIVDLRTQIADVFMFDLEEERLRLRAGEAINLTLGFPSFRTSRVDQSGTRSVSLKLTLPLLGLRRSLDLVAKLSPVENGRKVQLSYGREGTGMLAGFATVTKQPEQAGINIEAELTSDAGLLWSAKSIRALVSAGLHPAKQNYALIFDSQIFVDDVSRSVVSARLQGASSTWPSKLSQGGVRATGFTDWELLFDFSQPDSSKLFSSKLIKLGNVLSGPYSVNVSLGSTGQPGGRNFRFETESPQRHVVIAREYDLTQSRKSVEFFLNKRRGHGLVWALRQGPRPMQRTLELDLPTRLLRLDFQPLSEPGRSLGLGLGFAWDAKRSSEKEIRLDLLANYNRDSEIVWAVSASCQAPFLHDHMKLELWQEATTGTEGGSALVLRQLASDREVARARVGYQRRLRRIDLLLETSGATLGDEASSRLSVAIMRGNYTEGGTLRRLMLGDVKIEVPSQGVNKSFKFIYRPIREFTFTCDNGSSISVQFTPGSRLDRLTIFASGNDHQAARLDAQLDRPKSHLTATLDTGLGGIDFSTDLRVASHSFWPNASLMLASAGVSEDGRQAHAAVLVGRMSVGQWPDPTRPASVSPGVNLFSMGLQLHRNNTLEYSSAWRSVQADGVKSAVAHLKEALLDTWTSSGLRALGSALNALLRAGRDRLLKAVDAKRLSEEATNPLLADLESFRLYAETIAEAAGNDPRLGVVVQWLKRAFNAASNRINSATDAIVRALTAGGATLIDLRLAERVQHAADVTVEFLDGLPVLSTWRDSLDACKEAAARFGAWFGRCLESADAGLRKILHATGITTAGSNATASMLWLLSERAGQVVPLGAAREQVALALQQIESALANAASKSLDWLATDLKPFIIGHSGDLVKLKDWYDDVIYALSKWIEFGPSTTEREALSRPQRLASLLTGPESLSFWRNAGEGWSLVTSGEFAAGVRRLLMTDAYRVRVWRPICDAACQTLGEGEASYAEVVGTIYSPVYIDSLSPRVWQRRLALVRSIRLAARRIRDRLFATSSDGYVLLSMFNDWRQMDASLWDPTVRLLAMRHRTMVLAGGNSIITFDGVSLVNPRPCSYILAHDFRENEFTLAQSYRSINGTPTRHDLLIRFGRVQYSVSPSGVFRVDNRIERLPMNRYVGGRKVEAERSKSLLLVRFHGEILRNTLLLRCNSITDSCVLRVHPLYQARIDGLAGSNDGHRANDLRGGNRDSHVRFWTSGACLADTGESSGSGEAASAVGLGSSDAAVCKLWFTPGSSSFDKCFNTVDPEPYLELCGAYARLRKDVCEVAIQYTDRCRNELVNINTPYRCVRCRIDEETSIVKDDLVSDPRILRKRLQVVFLLENSTCAGQSIGRGGTSLSYLANLIDRIKTRYTDVKSVEFGLAHYGGSGDNHLALTAHPIHDTSGRFGTLADLNAGLVKTRLNGTSVQQFDVLGALAALQTQYQWEPLAQKHVFLVTCQECTARSWDYAKAFDNAFRSISSEIFLHVLTKRGIPKPTRTNDWLQNLLGYDRKETFYSDRRSEPISGLAALNPSGDCSAELAMDMQNKASGTVWHLDRFAASRRESVELSRKIFSWLRDRLGQPLCQRCTCALSDTLVGRPRCHVDSCPPTELDGA